MVRILRPVVLGIILLLAGACGEDKNTANEKGVSGGSGGTGNAGGTGASTSSGGSFPDSGLTGGAAGLAGSSGNTGSAGTAGAAGCVTSPTGISAWWRGTNGEKDHVGSNHGTIVKAATSGAPGYVGKGFSFTGSGYIEVPSSAALNVGSEDFSIELWLKTPKPTEIKVLVEKRVGPSPATLGYSLFLWTSGAPGVQLANSKGWTNYVGDTSIADDQWHHLVVSVDRDKALNFYVDGKITKTVDPSARSGSLSSTSPLRLGARTTTSSSLGEYAGALDEMSLYRRALTQAEVTALYAANTFGKCP